MKYEYYYRMLFTGLLITSTISGYSQGHNAGTGNDGKIAVFIRVWGFLKYYHPAVAKGCPDWDSVFLSDLPLIRRTNSKGEFNSRLLSIINDLGPLEKDRQPNQPDTLFAQNHDLSWIDHDDWLYTKIRDRLKEIYVRRYRGANRYIKLKDLTADYSGEKKYEKMAFPQQDYRLLFLSRFWNAINYFAPYKYVIGEDWVRVLPRLIPKMAAAEDTVSYYRALLDLAVSLNDGHAQVSLDNGDNRVINDIVFGKYTAPVYADIVDGVVILRKPANDSLCAMARIKKGDRVVAIDGEPIVDRLQRLGRWVSASNKGSRNKQLMWVLFDTQKHRQALRIKRGKQIFTASVQCIRTSERNWGDLTNYTYNATGYKAVGNSIAYVYASQIWHGDLDSIKALIKSKKAVIFDVRNYPNNDDFYNIFDIFLPGLTPINQSLCLAPGHPGYFTWQLSPKIGNINNSPYPGKVLVLVDERTQSQGEYSAMCLQTIPGSVTIGSQTAGADGVVTFIPMGGHLTLTYSGYGIFYPDKTPTQRRGVKIDIPVRKTLADLLTDRDAILEEALQYLKKSGIE
jgi:carboxyl-terminal processing protease